MGTGIAGLAAACVLARHFERVTLVERDRLAGTTPFHKGIPQARHAHGLTSQGAAALESLFPGLGRELEQAGAPVFDHGQSISTWVLAGHTPYARAELPVQVCTRPLVMHAELRWIMWLTRLSLHSAAGLRGLFNVAALGMPLTPLGKEWQVPPDAPLWPKQTIGFLSELDSAEQDMPAPTARPWSNVAER